MKNQLKTKNNMVILIDNGHGSNTAGKCSPDKSLREYAYTREIAQRVVEALKAKGYDARRIVTEETDISLGERCRRVNKVCDKVGKSNVLFVSIHVDAAGSEHKWLNAGGWTAYTTRGKTKADDVAEVLYKSAKVHLAEYSKRLEEGKKNGTYSEKQKAWRTDFLDGDSDKEANFYVLAHTNCPAVLTENLFQDNKADVAYLLSEEGKKAIVDIHVEGLINYIKKV